jgi:hypothetical protein
MRTRRGKNYGGINTSERPPCQTDLAYSYDSDRHFLSTGALRGLSGNSGILFHLEPAMSLAELSNCSSPCSSLLFFQPSSIVLFSDFHLLLLFLLLEFNFDVFNSCLGDYYKAKYIGIIFIKR